MEISGEKKKLRTNNSNGMTTHVQIAGNTLDEVESFKYLSATINEEGSKTHSSHRGMDNLKNSQERPKHHSSEEEIARG